MRKVGRGVGKLKDRQRRFVFRKFSEKLKVRKEDERTKRKIKENGTLNTGKGSKGRKVEEDRRLDEGKEK